MNHYFVTHGAGHPLSKAVIGIAAKDEHSARVAIFEIIGDKWAFIYDANDKDNGLVRQAKEWGYDLIWCIAVYDYGEEGKQYSKMISNEVYLQGVKDDVAEDVA